jgi:magnesium transporter
VKGLLESRAAFGWLPWHKARGDLVQHEVACSQQARDIGSEFDDRELPLLRERMARSKSKQIRKHLRHIRRRTAPGTAPGTIQVDPAAATTSIRAMAYSPNDFHEEENFSLQRLAELQSRFAVVWVDITGLGSREIMDDLTQRLKLHPLAMEDVVNVHQRAKADPYDDCFFVVARMLDDHNTLSSEQISMFVMKGLIVSFQERPGDCWEPIRQRMRQARGRVRVCGADFLCYLLLDAIIDSYFPVVDRISELIDQADDDILRDPDSKHMQQVHEIRSQLLSIRRSIRPHREMLNELIRDDHPLIQSETRVFLRDCYDHVIQLMDLVDTYRELTADLRDFYLSAVSNKMNEVMKVLTIISTIFIPLSFIAGIYGMNFDTSSPWNMPELSWQYGYPSILGVMAVLGFGLLLAFYRRNWI